MPEFINSFLEQHPDKQQEITRFVECFEDVFKAAVIAPINALNYLATNYFKLLPDEKTLDGIDTVKYFFSTALTTSLYDKEAIKEKLKEIESLELDEDEQAIFAKGLNSFVEMSQIMKKDANAGSPYHILCCLLLNELVDNKINKIIEYSRGDQIHSVSGKELLIKMDAVLDSVLAIAGAENPISYSQRVITPSIVTPPQLFSSSQQTQRKTSTKVSSQVVAAGALAAGTAITVAAAMFSNRKIKLRSRM